MIGCGKDPFDEIPDRFVENLHSSQLKQFSRKSTKHENLLA